MHQSVLGLCSQLLGPGGRSYSALWMAVTPQTTCLQSASHSMRSSRDLTSPCLQATRFTYQYYMNLLACTWYRTGDQASFVPRGMLLTCNLSDCQASAACVLHIRVTADPTACVDRCVRCRSTAALSVMYCWWHVRLYMFTPRYLLM